jgi:hypothetical protein
MAGHAELRPPREVLTVLIEDHDSLVAPIGDEDPPAGVHRNRAQSTQLARPGAGFAEGLDEFSSFENLTMRLFPFALWPSAMKMSPFGAVAVGSDAAGQR